MPRPMATGATDGDGTTATLAGGAVGAVDTLDGATVDTLRGAAAAMVAGGAAGN